MKMGQKQGAEGEDGERGGGKSARRRKESAEEAKAERGGGERVVGRAALGGGRQ